MLDFEINEPVVQALLNLGILCTKNKKYITKRYDSELNKSKLYALKFIEKNKESTNEKVIEKLNLSYKTVREAKYRDSIITINTIGYNTFFYDSNYIVLTDSQRRNSLQSMLDEYNSLDEEIKDKLIENRNSKVKNVELSKIDRLYNFLNDYYNAIKYLYPHRLDENNNYYKSVDKHIVEGFNLLLNLKKTINPKL